MFIKNLETHHETYKHLLMYEYPIRITLRHSVLNFQPYHALTKRKTKDIINSKFVISH